MPERVEFPPPSAPYEVARQLFRDYLTDAGMSKLAAWRRGWMAWRVTHWTEIDTAQLRQSVYAALSRAFYWHETKDGTEERDWNPDRHKVTNVLEALAAVVHLPSDIDPPAWINDTASTVPPRSLRSRLARSGYRMTMRRTWFRAVMGCWTCPTAHCAITLRRCST